MPIFEGYEMELFKTVSFSLNGHNITPSEKVTRNRLFIVTGYFKALGVLKITRFRRNDKRQSFNHRCQTLLTVQYYKFNVLDLQGQTNGQRVDNVFIFLFFLAFYFEPNKKGKIVERRGLTTSQQQFILLSKCILAWP